MSKTIYRFLFFPCILLHCFIYCKPSSEKGNILGKSQASPLANLQETDFVNCSSFGVKSKPLLSTRFKDLTHFKTLVSINYDQDYSKMDSNDCRQSIVHLSYESNGEKIMRSMSSGVNQDEILNLQKANYFTRTRFVFTHPGTIRQRIELEKAYVLARRRADLFGPGDIAFYDLAEASFRHINTPDLAFHHARDSSEKGYINTFNHVTAQALITLLFSEELADFIADLHERFYMPELTSGRFNASQLLDSINNPVDNYVDIINNEIGQKIGNALKDKYTFNEKTVCTPVLLAAYLNDIQRYYIWSLEIGLDNFRPSDEALIKFSNKINTILKRS